MPWIPHEHMADVHIIRQDYAAALKYNEEHPGDASGVFSLDEVSERRDRAIRSLHRDDNASVRHLAAMFRCSKTTVRDILAADTED